jgi:hypothetical protein
MMAIRLLLDHGIRADHIIFATFVIAASGGVVTIRNAFPGVRIVTGAVDEKMVESWVNEDGHRRHVWNVEPGMGRIGSRLDNTVFGNGVLTLFVTPRRPLFLSLHWLGNTGLCTRIRNSPMMNPHMLHRNPFVMNLWSTSLWFLWIRMLERLYCMTWRCTYTYRCISHYRGSMDGGLEQCRLFPTMGAITDFGKRRSG